MAASPRKIERPLCKTFQPIQLVVEDNSAEHTGHTGVASGGGHHNVEIVSTTFAGKNRLARHRIVYDALHTLWPAAIHALTIRTVTPKENT